MLNRCAYKLNLCNARVFWDNLINKYMTVNKKSCITLKCSEFISEGEYLIPFKGKNILVKPFICKEHRKLQWKLEDGAVYKDSLEELMLELDKLESNRRRTGSYLPQ